MAASSDPDAVEAQLEWEEFDPGRGVSFRQHMMAGSCAGVAEHLLMFPVDTYKVRPSTAAAPARNTRRAG